MRSKRRKRSSRRPGPYGSLATTSVGAAIKAAGVANPIALLFISLLPNIASLALDEYYERKRDDVRRWWAQLVADTGRPLDELQAELTSRIGEPEIHGVITESLKSVLDAHSPVAVPALGALAAEYIREGKAPDWFFLGVKRLLPDLSRSELSWLRVLLRCFSRLDIHEAASVREVRFADGRPTALNLIYRSTTNSTIQIYALPAAPFAFRLANQMKLNNLAWGESSGGFWAGNNPQDAGQHLMAIRRDDADRLERLLRPARRRSSSARR